MNRCLGIINLDESERRMEELVNNRPLASVPFGGRYRIIDFVLSNMTNSGIESIGVFTKNKSRSLMDHISNGKPWDLDRKTDGLRVFNFGDDIPFLNDVHNFYNNIDFLELSKYDYVLLSPSYMICNIDLKEALEYYGMTEEKVNSFLENMVNTDKVKEAMPKDVTVTDEEVEQYYNDNIDKYTTKAGANAKHVLFETEEEAQAAKNKIDSGEATFDEIYAEYEANNDGSGTLPVSQDLGYVENEEEGYDTDFLAGFKILKEGEISAPIKSSFGYHIVKVEGLQTEEKVTSLDEVKDTIKSTLLSEKQKETYNSTLEEWKKELNVKLYEDKL